MQFYVENGRLFWYVQTCTAPLHFCSWLFFFFLFSINICYFCDWYLNCFGGTVFLAPVRERHGISTTLTCGSGSGALNVVSRRRCTSNWQVTLCRLTSVTARCRGRAWRSPPILNLRTTFPPGYVLTSARNTHKKKPVYDIDIYSLNI